MVCMYQTDTVKTAGQQRIVFSYQIMSAVRCFRLVPQKNLTISKKKSAVFRNAILIQVIISFKLSDETQVIKDAIKNINTNMNILRKKQFIPCALD